MSNPKDIDTWKALMFVCPICGPRVKADEDGCCVFCGADCRVEPYVAPPDITVSEGPT